MQELGKAIFDSLGIIRIYTKEPGNKVHSDHPFALRKGATVNELAKEHPQGAADEFHVCDGLGEAVAFSPKKVGMNFVLDDGDIVEIHARIV